MSKENQELTLDQAKEQIATLTTENAQLKSTLEAANKDKEVAQNEAINAINKYNELANNSEPKEDAKLIVTVNKEKYKVLFGVDGKTKEEIANDAKECARLVKIGSGALEKLEG